MGEISAGKDVLSYCNKCKLTLAHTIVVMKNANTIGKVECNTCKSTHAYKDPSSVQNAKKKTSLPLNRMKMKTTSVSVSDLWMEAISKMSGKSKAYSVKDKFLKGDIIDHPKFGPGIIERCIDNDKIEVMFRHDIKTLVHNR